MIDKHDLNDRLLNKKLEDLNMQIQRHEESAKLQASRSASVPRAASTTSKSKTSGKQDKKGEKISAPKQQQ